MKDSDIITHIIEFMKQAGAIALEKQKKIDFIGSKLKTDSVIDVVTQTDILISDLFRKFVDNVFSDLNPLIVDEETVANLGENPLDKIKAAEYAFIIDPIDGTLPYSAKLPLYGISVGVFKKGKPYLGAIYAPSLGTLVYDDGQKVYAVENAFLPSESAKELTRTAADANNAPLFFASPTKIKLNDKWNKNDAVPIDLYSAVLNCIGTAKGQGWGYYFKCYLWDIAGSLSIFDKLGIKVWESTSKDELNPVDNQTFNNRLYSMKTYIVCRPKYFEYLKSIIDTGTDYK